MHITRYTERERHHWRTARPWAECSRVLVNASRPEGTPDWTVTLRGETEQGAVIRVTLNPDEVRELRDYLDRLVFPG